MNYATLLSKFQPMGVDLFCTSKKFLVFNLVSRNLKIKYRRSLLGLLWTLAHPLAMTAIYYFVFKVILQVKMAHYLVFMLSGVLTWSFFSATLSEGLESLVGNFGLLTKVPIPIQVFSYVGTITNVVTWILSLPVLLSAAWISGTGMGWSLFVLPYFVVLLFLVSYGVSLILSMAFVFFRDLRHILGLGLQLWFYATPVIYDESMIPEKYKWLLNLNPVAKIFTGIHGIFVEGRWPSQSELGVPFLWTLAIVLLALFLRRRWSDQLVENL